MKHVIKIQEICQCNHISKEHAELIIKEIQNALDLYLEVVLSFKGITSISFEASSIILNYIYDNKLEKSIYIINMTRYVRQKFFWNSKTSKETNENFIPNDKQNNEELIDKFEEWLNKNFTDRRDEWDKIDGVYCGFDSFNEMMENFEKTFKIKQ